MSVQEKLEHDQEKIKMLIHDIENLSEEKSDLRAPLFVKLKEEIKTLYNAEEEIVHNVIKDSDLLKDGVIDRKQDVKQILNELDGESTNSDQWREMFVRLKDRVFKQIGLEQEELTPIIDEVIAKPEAAAEDIAEHKDEQLGVEILEMPKKS